VSKALIVVLAAVCVVFLAGCGAAKSNLPAGQVEAPTVSAYFRVVSPTVGPTRTVRPTLAPAPTRTPGAGTLTISGVATREETVYADAPAQGWSLEFSQGMSYTQGASLVHGGRVAIAVTPTMDFGALLLALRADTGLSYQYKNVLGVSFWLNGGKNVINPEDLAVTVLGSNAYPYFKADDTSVQLGDNTYFSETRLYYLGINRPIPAETWVEVTLLLKNLPYDPSYTYITALYIKNDEGVRNTFYVDDVRLLVAAP
jgi:hypothetical protein